MECKQELFILVVVHLVVHLALHGALDHFEDVQVLAKLLFASLVNLVVLIRLHEPVCALFELAAKARLDEAASQPVIPGVRERPPVND